MFILIIKIITSKLNILKFILLSLFIYDANKLQGSCVVWCIMLSTTQQHENENKEELKQKHEKDHDEEYKYSHN